MGTKEFVEKYASECFAKIIKFVIVQIILDVIEIVVFILTLIADINKQRNLYVTIAAFAILFIMTIFINIRVSFGRFKTFVKNVNIYNGYSNATKDFMENKDERLFNEKLAELEIKIKEK